MHPSTIVLASVCRCSGRPVLLKPRLLGNRNPLSRYSCQSRSRLIHFSTNLNQERPRSRLNHIVPRLAKMPSFVASIDQGTSSSRFIIFNGEDGSIVDLHQLEFPQHYPQPGWHEHNPIEILDSVNQCIEVVLKKFLAKGHSLSDLKAVGVTNQRETTVVWDRITGKPLFNAIVWTDTRNLSIVSNLSKRDTQKGADILKEMTGLPISTYFSAVKLRWILDNVPEVKKAYDEDRLAFGTVDSWLLYCLTGAVNGGVHVTDVTNASRTLFMNLKTLEWDPSLLEFFDIKANVLPKIVSCAEIYGKFSSGPLKGIPIAGCLGDQQAALVGQKCFNIGDAKNTYGTGCFMLFNTGEKTVMSKNGLVTTVAYQLGSNAKPIYALEGSIAVAGSAVKWVRDNLGLIKTASEIGDLASKVKDSGGIVFVTAFSGLFAPYWDDTARGLIIGLTGYTTKEHICRATLDATCFQTRDIINAMNSDSGHPLRTLKVDGGLTNSDVCMQMQADVLGIEVDRPEMRESSAFGSAIAAAIAVGLWDVKDLGQVNSKGHTIFVPNESTESRDARYQVWKKAVEKSIGWIDEQTGATAI